MSIAKATELVRGFARELSMEDLDFSELHFALLVDDRSVTVEYLVNSDQFLIYGPLAAEIGPNDVEAHRFVQDAAHALAMEGGGALTVDRNARRILFSQTVAREVLDADELGLCISGVSQVIAELSSALAAHLAGAGGKATSTPEESYTLRL